MVSIAAIIVIFRSPEGQKCLIGLSPFIGAGERPMGFDGSALVPGGMGHDT